MGGWYRFSFWFRRWVFGGESLGPHERKPNGKAGWVWCGKTPRHKPASEAQFQNTFTLVDDGRAIRCNRCGLESYSRDDVRHRYCGNCGYYE
jgi:hypothetical protein